MTKGHSHLRVPGINLVRHSGVAGSISGSIVVDTQMMELSLTGQDRKLSPLGIRVTAAQAAGCWTLG